MHYQDRIHLAGLVPENIQILQTALAASIAAAIVGYSTFEDS